MTTLTKLHKLLPSTACLIKISQRFSGIDHTHTPKYHLIVHNGPDWCIHRLYDHSATTR